MRRVGVVLEFAEPFGSLYGPTVTVPLPAPGGAQGLTVREVLELAGIPVDGLDGMVEPELSAFVTVNGRALLPQDRFSAVVRDGDVVSFRLMLSGG